jgi:hypothetical protein
MLLKKIYLFKLSAARAQAYAPVADPNNNIKRNTIIIIKKLSILYIKNVSLKRSIFTNVK